MTEKVIFCPCGRPLATELNARYDRKVLGYCNKECKDRHERKQKRKYGLGGYVYGRD